MTIVQVNSGQITNAAAFTPTLGSATSGSNRLALFVAGNTTVTTLSGWTLRTSQVNEMGHYLYDRAGDGGTSWGPWTNVSGDLTWVVLEIQAGVYISGSGQNSISSSTTYSTPNNTPTAGTRCVVASIASLIATTAVRTVSGRTNSFVEQADLCVADSDYPMQGVAVLDNVAANGSTAYSTTATYSQASTGRSALIASYETSSGAPAATSFPFKRSPHRGLILRGRR